MVSEAFKQLPPLVRATIREAREHPAILAAIVMRPMGYRWENHRWVERSR